MSLINDALKRAKAAQDKEKPAATPPLQFRPVDPEQKSPNNFQWRFVIGLAVLLIGGYLLFKLASSRESLQVEAKGANDLAKTAPQPTNAPPVAAPTTLEPTTQQLAVAVSPKLQSLFYNPTRPSAIISGHAVVVGDKVGDFRVTAITRSSVTLVSATETNILTFGE